MYKVMIVDDEDIIVSGLVKVMPWAKYGCEVAATASDGLAAQAVLRAGFAGFLKTGQSDVPVFQLVVEEAAPGSAQGALGPLHFHHIGAQLHFHPFGQFEGQFTYSGHDYFYLG